MERERERLLKSYERERESHTERESHRERVC